MAKKFKRAVRLNRPQDVRRLLSRLVNQVLKGEVEPEVLRVVTYASQTILKSLEVGELAERLDKIEFAVGGKS